MARYYFDVRGRKGHQRDEFGEEFDDFDEVRAQAQALLPDLVREELPDGDLHAVSCEVRDESGRVVYRGEITYRGRDLRGEAAGGDGSAAILPA